MLGETEEQPNMADSEAFPTLPAKNVQQSQKTVSVWSEPSKSVIGVNVHFFIFCDIVFIEEPYG